MNTNRDNRGSTGWAVWGHGRSRWLLALVLTLVMGPGVPMAAAVTTAEASSPAVHRALIVGIDHYDPSYGPGSLPSCINDATGMRDVLLASVPGAAVQLLTDAQATKSVVRSALWAMAGEAGADDVIVFFQSSHGGQDAGTQTYLCMYDGDYTDAELASDLGAFGTSQKIIVIVDACHSGGLFKGAEWPFAQQIMKTYKAHKSAQLRAKGQGVPYDLGSNIAFMTACDYDETCRAGAVYSLFTEYLLRACTVSSADLNGDGNYQFWEVYAYAEQAARQNPNQTAQYYNQPLLQGTIARVGQADARFDAPDEDTDDSFEPNNTWAEARAIENGRHELVGLDEDWFVVEIPTGGDVTIAIEGTEGDLDLFLLDTDGNVVAQSRSYSSSEEISGTADPGTYYLAIAPYENQGGSYTLTLNTPLLSGESDAAPEPVAPFGCGAGAAQALAVGLCTMLAAAARGRCWISHRSGGRQDGR